MLIGYSDTCRKGPTAGASIGWIAIKNRNIQLFKGKKRHYRYRNPCGLALLAVIIAPHEPLLAAVVGGAIVVVAMWSFSWCTVTKGLTP